MTLELARKRRSQCDLIDELVEALEACRDDCGPANHAIFPWLRVGDKCPLCSRVTALIEKAKEHDCIPVDDAKEAAAER